MDVVAVNGEGVVFCRELCPSGRPHARLEQQNPEQSDSGIIDLCQRRIKTRPAWQRKNRPLDCDVTDMRTAPAGAVLISAACLAVGISCR